MSRIARIRIPAYFTELKVEPTPDGARIVVGTTHVHLKRDLAIAVADALIDATEAKETA